jgi:uncharacterized protein (DUF983 family)
MEDEKVTELPAHTVVLGVEMVIVGAMLLLTVTVTVAVPVQPFTSVPVTV